MTDKKPREWEVSVPVPDKPFWSERVVVIEKSYADQLEKERDELKDELSDLKECYGCDLLAKENAELKRMYLDKEKTCKSLYAENQRMFLDVAELKRQLDEQLLVNGKGQQRELKLMTERDELKRQLKATLEDLRELQEMHPRICDSVPYAHKISREKLEAELKAAREEIERLQEIAIERGREIYYRDTLIKKCEAAREETERLRTQLIPLAGDSHTKEYSPSCIKNILRLPE